MLDIEALLAPIDDASPAGPDLEYDAEWQALERAAQGKPEQQFGDTIIPAEEPDWLDVGNRAEGLLGRSKDVRSASLLAQAQVRLHQFPGLLSGLQLVHQLVERYWDTVHPMLDASDGNDPTMRLNAMSALADPGGLQRLARGAQLFASRALGDLTLRQVEVAAGKAAARSDEAVPSQSQVDQQIAAAISADPGFVETVTSTLAAAKGLSSFLDEQVGSDRSLDFKPLIGSLFTLSQVVTRVAASMSGGDGGDGDGSGFGGDEGGGGGGTGINTTGAIRSRQDAIMLMDKISDFLARTEPSNPAPLLIQRAKRLMEMSFIDILKELAPDGLNQARNVTGVRDEE
ncbi:type VI secretion system protein ImpA [Panacagrimonas perspica]|uniref:Type VI secretion system protein ImpA n=1 Tax=Panacagrimonas perspica TaxID=381431 RepID=A0A4S3JZV0_9GAMM|nr:type VI secretion system protein TssA [Panacagrimonas perspica]TDU31186.1 type VI secretion system protein ImpA [Panacagrimonas perspica]THD01058.1 hypothetical protein B1810_21795 [Panacagrimonas perspica]